jgi:hypothetical protein
MHFKDYLVEYKLLGTLKKYEKIIINNYLDFLNDYFNLNINVEVSFRKPSTKRLFGWIDLIGLKNKKYKIIVENTQHERLNKIAHEFTHIAQFIKGDLDYTKDEKTFLWKGKENLTIKEYNSITNYNEYKKVPWEKEAYENQEKLPVKYQSSDFFKKLKGIDPTIDFMIDNNLF